MTFESGKWRPVNINVFSYHEGWHRTNFLIEVTFVLCFFFVTVLDNLFYMDATCCKILCRRNVRFVALSAPSGSVDGLRTVVGTDVCLDNVRLKGPR